MLKAYGVNYFINISKCIWLSRFTSRERQQIRWLYKTFDILWKNKKNDDASQVFPASLDKLEKERNEPCDKVNQLLASQNRLKDKIDQFQMLVNTKSF